MKTRLLVLLPLVLSQWFAAVHTAQAQGTAFTFQGRLNDGANPATGSYDLQFGLWTAVSGPSQIGGTLTNSATAVSNGLFTVALDFGNQFPGADRWLEIAVRTNGGGAFSTLAPRQLLTPAPYAIYSAGAASAGSVAAANITGTIPLAQLPATVVTNGASGVNFSGTFSGNGAGVTNVLLDSLNDYGALYWPGGFVLNSSPGVGVGPTYVAAADVNGDGRLDLISANATANTLSVLTNNGSGGFKLSSSPGVGSSPRSVAAADVNGDGKLDLISANNGADTLSVLTNNGSGGFTLSSSPGVGDGPDFVVAADVNGDAKVDLISANYFADTLSVLTNNGSGAFTLSSSPGVGDTPLEVVAADVNGDAKVDLISANYFAGTLSVLTNNGSGGFVLSSSPGVGSGPESVAAADVNGDGKLDLISANEVGNTLTVLTNNGSGGFVLSSSPGVGSGPRSVAAADVNGDGRADLISANTGSSTLSVLTNNGSGGFVLSSSPGVGSGPFSVAAADVNGDGKLDLISANFDVNTLSVLINSPTFQGNLVGNVTGNVNAGTVTAGTVTVSPPGTIAFGATTRQMVNLYSTTFGIGIQNSIQYSRVAVGGGFAWYAGGTHSDTTYNAGGGSTLMKLDGGGLTVNGTFVSASDRNMKENFEPLDPREVLDKVAALPLSKWSYKQDSATRHLGPMAQDFYAAFGVGPDDKHIATVDESGVALAAIQGLNEKTEDRSQKSEDRIQKLEAENAELKARLEKLERLMNEKHGGGK